MNRYILVSTLLIFGFCRSNAEARTLKTSVNITNLATTKTFTERGLEIRYYVLDKKSSATGIPSEVIIDKVTYKLYKTREEAINAVTHANPKKDYTVVYVVSDKKKSTELVTIEGEN
jgi:hypothetical protein